MVSRGHKLADRDNLLPAQVAVYRVVTEANEVVALEVIAVDGYNFKTYIVMEYCDKGTLEQHRCVQTLCTLTLCRGTSRCTLASLPEPLTSADASAPCMPRRTSHQS